MGKIQSDNLQIWQKTGQLDYCCTNYEQVRKGGKACDSDHATQILDVNLTVIDENPKKKRIIKFSKERRPTKIPL